MELYHETFLRRAGAMIGIVLKIDKLTLIHSRGKFARICVEVDLKKKLVSKISKGEYLLCQVWGVTLLFQVWSVWTQGCAMCWWYGGWRQKGEYWTIDTAPTVKEPEVQAAKEGESVRADVISNNGVINVEVPNMVTGEVNMVMTSNPNDFAPWMIAKKLFRRKAKSSSKEVIGGKNKLN